MPALDRYLDQPLLLHVIRSCRLKQCLFPPYLTLPYFISSFFSFPVLAHARPLREKVCLCGFRQLKDEDVQLLLDSCPALSLLSVADCTTLGSLVLSSRQLRSLDVSRCIHISEMSLETPGEARTGVGNRASRFYVFAVIVVVVVLCRVEDWPGQSSTLSVGLEIFPPYRTPNICSHRL